MRTTRIDMNAIRLHYSGWRPLLFKKKNVKQLFFFDNPHMQATDNNLSSKAMSINAKNSIMPRYAVIGLSLKGQMQSRSR